MTVNSSQKKTLDPANLFAFVCPVFNAPVKIAGCFILRDLVWRGDRQPTRRGCQVAMDACKCPINQIIKDMGRLDDDPYHSNEPNKVGKLRDDVLDRIAPILVPEGAISRADLPIKETMALRQCNEEAHKYSASPIKRKKRERRRDPNTAEIAAVDRPAPKPIKTDTAGVDAAKTGDMTAALNAEIKGETP